MMNAKLLLLVYFVAFATQIRAESQAEFAVTNADVTHAKVIYGMSEKPTLEIHLKPAPAKAFQAFTQTNLMKTVSIRLAGEIVSEPKVREAILGSTLELAMDDEDKMIRLAKALTQQE